MSSRVVFYDRQLRVHEGNQQSLRMHNNISIWMAPRSAYGDIYISWACKVSTLVGGADGALQRHAIGSHLQAGASPSPLAPSVVFTGLAEGLPKLTRLQRLDLTVQVIAASKLQPLPLNSCWCVYGTGRLWCLTASWWWCSRLYCSRLCESKTKEREGGGEGEL